MIIAMAGHVDHGKTSLIRALTGIDPDRLPDEKARGMTIDLGFAHTTLPSGHTIGFVDVPGHERFLSNMLAGVLSIDTVLLVVAADDGPMPQTHEHLSVLRLIGVSDLAVAVTKTDRVEAGRIEAVLAAIGQMTARAGYGVTPVFPLSSHTGSGVPPLRDYLADRAARHQPPPARGGFRMAIDRAFVMQGTGLVVTGTAAAGQVRVGDRLLISPTRLAARVRGIQVHHQPADTARAADRCALAIAGVQIEKAHLRRGDWVIAPHLHAPTQRADVLLATTGDRTLRHAGRVHAHLGAAAIGAKVLVLGGADLPPGQEALVNVALDRPTAALFGDRIVLRDDTTGRVVAGGRVVDPFPPARRVRREQRQASLAAQAEPDPSQALAGLLAAEGSVDLARFALARNLDLDALAAGAAALPATLIGRSGRPILLSHQTNAAIADHLENRLRDWHDRHPGLPGPGKAALLASLPTYPAEITEAVLLDLMAAGRVLRREAALHLPGHQARLSAADEAYWQRIGPLLRDAGIRPPRVRELAEALALEPADTEALLVRLERFGHLLRVAPNRFFLPDTVVRLGDIAAALAADAEDGTFSAALFNQRAGIGRNLTIEVLEFLDRTGVSQRAGERRFMLRPAGEVFG